MKILKTITILGDPRVKKNSKRIVGKRIISSKNFLAWEKLALIQIPKRPISPDSWPVMIHFKFFPATHRKFDLGNMSEGTLDALQKCKVIPDDDYHHVIPMFHGPLAGVQVDKEKPRIEITITELLPQTASCACHGG